MKQLAVEEKDLGQGLPVGTQLGLARSFLQARGIVFYEQNVKLEQEIPQPSSPSMVVHPDDRLVSARITTDAGRFPCGYAVEIGLVFDAHDVLRENRVNRLRLCP